MSDFPIPPPEPMEIDEKTSTELPIFSAEVDLGGETGTGTTIVAAPYHRRGSGPDSDPVSEGIAALSELTEAGVEVDGELQIAESTWIIYGHTSYDGEIIVGEYHDFAEVAAVFRAAPRRPDDDPPVG